MASADRTMKDKEMASRMKGSGEKVVRSNGIEKFVTHANAEYRTTMQCPMCHGQCSVTGFDAHLRTHMAGASESESKAA